MCIKPDEVLNDHNSTSEDMSTSTLLRQVSDISSSRVHLTLIVLNKMSGAIYDSGTALSVPEGGSVVSHRETICLLGSNNLRVPEKEKKRHGSRSRDSRQKRPAYRVERAGIRGAEPITVSNATGAER